MNNAAKNKITAVANPDNNPAKPMHAENDKASCEFLAQAGHQIRTSMNAITGFCEVLAAQELTEEQRGYVNIIRESSRNLLELTSNVLDFFRAETGQLKPEITYCPLEQLTATIESHFRPAAMSCFWYHPQWLPAGAHSHRCGMASTMPGKSCGQCYQGYRPRLCSTEHLPW